MEKSESGADRTENNRSAVLTIQLPDVHIRFEETPERLLIELAAGGTDYAVLEETVVDDFTANWEYLRIVLEDAEAKSTRQQLLDAWPVDFPKPAQQTLWRWLDRALEEQRVCRDGTGRRRKPYRYWLPHKEEEWKQDPLHELLHGKVPDLREILRQRKGA